MTTIPEMCMQYTAVFQALKLENVIVGVCGVLIGIAAGWLHRR